MKKKLGFLAALLCLLALAVTLIGCPMDDDDDGDGDGKKDFIQFPAELAGTINAYGYVSCQWNKDGVERVAVSFSNYQERDSSFMFDANTAGNYYYTSGTLTAKDGDTYTVKESEGEETFTFTATVSGSTLTISGTDLTQWNGQAAEPLAGTYTKDE